jgi:hypothetical protein
MAKGRDDVTMSQDGGTDSANTSRLLVTLETNLPISDLRAWLHSLGLQVIHVELAEASRPDHRPFAQRAGLTRKRERD